MPVNDRPTQALEKPFLQMNDDEIIEQCRAICNKHKNKDKATTEIYEWSGQAPLIIAYHYGRHYKFAGVICSPTLKTLRF